MGEMADDYGFNTEFDYPDAEDFMHLSDDEIRKETSAVRSVKLKSIRAWPNKLSQKQRYCLAAWLAERDVRHA